MNSSFTFLVKSQLVIALCKQSIHSIDFKNTQYICLIFFNPVSFRLRSCRPTFFCMVQPLFQAWLLLSDVDFHVLYFSPIAHWSIQNIHPVFEKYFGSIRLLFLQRSTRLEIAGCNHSKRLWQQLFVFIEANKCCHMCLVRNQPEHDLLQSFQFMAHTYQNLVLLPLFNCF